MLEVKNLTISLATAPLLRGVSFQVKAGETLTLMGASGSGKSTLFAWMAGALDPAFRASGELWIDGERCDRWPTERRRPGLLLQEPLLFDHFNVGGNLLLALPSGGDRTTRKAQVEQALTDAGLAGFFHRDPGTLSGGQRARVSLLRTLLARPPFLLLDEPFSRLDAGLRESFRRQVFSEAARLAIPVVLVTHDAADIPDHGRCLQMAVWQ